MTKPKLGDIIEIKTPMGRSYALFTHQHRVYGSLLQVWNAHFGSSPPNFDFVNSQAPSFACFFPLVGALERDLVTIVENVQIPSSLSKFPVFRAGTPDRQSKKVEKWWLWDGEKEWAIGSLTPVQQKLPIRGVWNDTLLIERIDAGWTPQADATT